MKWECLHSFHSCSFMRNNERHRNAFEKMQYVCIIQRKFSLAHTYIIKC